MTASRRRHAFSLLELLVVIALIAVLGSLLLMGIGHLIINSKRQQTRLTFQNLQAMYSEYDIVARRHFANYKDPIPYGWTGPWQVWVPCPENVTLDANPPGPPNTPMQANDVSSADRYGQAVWETRDIMALMKANPVSASALGKMSASALMIMPTNFIGSLPLPYANSVAAFSSSSSYAPVVDANDYGSASQGFATITVLNSFGIPISPPPVFRSIKPNATSTTNVSVSPPDSGYWIPVSFDDTVPIPLDAWGNPIIFVPGGALGSGIVLPADANGSGTFPTDAQGLGILRAGGNSFIVKSPDGRPFWASAGPDGDFSLGDDNLYSFEK